MDPNNIRRPFENQSIFEDVPPPERNASASAPPALELATESLFAFELKYANIFSDIRAHEEYYNFYQSRVEGGKKLPPPLEAPFYLDPNYAEEEIRGLTETFSLNHYPPPQVHETQQHFSNLNLGGKPVDIPRSSNGSLWTPIPRKMSSVPFDHYDEGQNLKGDPTLSRFNDINYSSSPSAQLAFNTAQFIWKDEESSNFSGPGSTNNVPYLESMSTNTLKKEPFELFNERDAPIKTEAKAPVPLPSPSSKEAPPRNETISPPPPQSSGNGSGSNGASTTICRYYAAGYCSRGEKCFYSHDVEPQVKKGKESNRKGGKSARGSSSAPSTPHKPAAVRPMSPEALPPLNSDIPISPRSGEFYTEFEPLIGKIYSVSKDQQGCRFLQKKLEEEDAKTTQIIFTEVYPHINELMIDPFGNYLCQKLLEYCNNDQRYAIVDKVAPDLVSISKNMHGTRAVQKMIECLSSPPQINLVKKALGSSVVDLIKDLNGNHVIQRCLHRLSTEDKQFIYDAVTTGDNCVQVATHRHGCCVLQRCIDHASEGQKVQIIEEITKNALVLVQDAYGNYVVQYVLDLPFPHLVEILARSFVNHVSQLSTQKFSSNVIEKCLGVAKVETRDAMIRTLLNDGQLASLLQDPFGNYVVQTALTVSDPFLHAKLVEAIKPHLAQLRNTPYGKRIQNKIVKEGSEPRNSPHKQK